MRNRQIFVTIIVKYLEENEVNSMVFGDNGPRKKSFLNVATALVVLIMLLVTVGGIDFPSSRSCPLKTLSRFFVYVGNFIVRLN